MNTSQKRMAAPRVLEGTYQLALRRYILMDQQRDELLIGRRVRQHSHRTPICNVRSLSLPSCETESRLAHPWEHGDCYALVDRERPSAVSAQKSLYEVNMGIKRALMELLNCDIVCCNRSMRMWAQERLFLTEMELRAGRRSMSPSS